MWASAENQFTFLKLINEWSDSNNTLTFIFEAFDEPWKGGDSPDEPEKNWGIYDVDRMQK